MNYALVPYKEQNNDLSITVDLHSKGEYCCIIYRVKGDLSEIIIPKKVDGKRANKLWLASSFELFIKDSTKTSHYKECNFGFDTRWNIFSFTAQRENMNTVAYENMHIEVQETPKTFTLSVILPWDMIDNKQCGFSAILKNSDGTRSFWALGHNNSKPNLHNSEFFSICPTRKMFR